MGPEDQRQSLSEAENRESVAHLRENAQEAVGKGLLSRRDEATTLSKKCIDQLMFTNRPFKACDEQGATMYVEATA